MPIKQNPNDLRRNSDFIDQQPTVNRFMDQQEIEWQKNQQQRPTSKSDKPGEKSKDKEKGKEKEKEDKPKEEEDESKYFCCS